MQYLDGLTRQAPELCTTELIGKTSEGRAMKIIKISRPNTNHTAPKPIVWIDAGIHAREWIAPATALFIATKVEDEEVGDLTLITLFFFAAGQ